MPKGRSFKEPNSKKRESSLGLKRAYRGSKGGSLKIQIAGLIGAHLKNFNKKRKEGFIIKQNEKIAKLLFRHVRVKVWNCEESGKDPFISPLCHFYSHFLFLPFLFRLFLIQSFCFRSFDVIRANLNPEESSQL